MKKIINKFTSPYYIIGPLLIVTFALIPASLEAEQLTEHEVKAAVQTWVRYVTAEPKPDAVIEKMEPYLIDEETVAYIAHIEGGGFCLCGADDLALPVYLYNPQGRYEINNTGYQVILTEIAERAKHRNKMSLGKAESFEIDNMVLEEREALWQDLISGQIPVQISATEEGASVEPEMMELSLTSQWHQGSPYNDQCPNLTPGEDERTLVGCNITALAQIMNYWKWPDTGVSWARKDYDRRGSTVWVNEPFAEDPELGNAVHGKSAEIEWVSDNGGTLRMKGYWDYSIVNSLIAPEGTPDDFKTAVLNLWNKLTNFNTTHIGNFGATSYNWDMMQDDHTDPPDNGDSVVAKLNYHLGIAMFAGWGTKGTSTNIAVNGLNALKYNFRYDNDAIAQAGADMEIMTEEIQWLRPFGLEGGNGISGHGFVVYGYYKGSDPYRMFLMNMGWDIPYSDHAWYTYDLMPFPINQIMSFHISPLNVVKFVGSDSSGDGSPSDPYENIVEAIADAPDGATLIFKAGSVISIGTGPMVISKALTLKGYDISIQ